MKKVISIIVAAMAVAIGGPVVEATVPAVTPIVRVVGAQDAEAHYFQASEARKYLWGYYNHDHDVATKRNALERERGVDIVNTILIEDGFHVNNSDHWVRAGWRFVRACYPGCGPDDLGSTAGFYDRYFDAQLGANWLVTDGPVIPN